MASNVEKRAGGDVVRPQVDETSVGGAGASGAVDRRDAKNGNDTPQSQNPWPVELGWDFPFDFPKQTR